MQKKTILIVSHHGDLHADIVSEIIQQKGHEVFRLHLDHFPRDYQIQLNLQDQARTEITYLSTGQKLELSSIGAVWLRKAAQFSFISEDLSAQEYAFAKAETEHILNGIIYSLQNVFWFSHPLALRSSQWKGEQLQRAKQMGFSTPKTIISNRPEDIRQLKNPFNSDLLFKAMSSPSLSAREVDPSEVEVGSLPATRISHTDFCNGVWDEELESIKELPGLFQEYIEKAYELRVTIIGQQCYAARILSQEDPRTATDYRDFSVDIPYQYTELQTDLAQKCVQFVRSYGLEYGAIDLIVTPENKVVFLENNPGGQFYFIEQLVPELKLCDAVADLLCTQAQSNDANRVRTYA